MYVITVTAFALWAIYVGILRQWLLVASRDLLWSFRLYSGDEIAAAIPEASGRALHQEKRVLSQASSCQLGPIPHGRVGDFAAPVDTHDLVRAQPDFDSAKCWNTSWNHPRLSDRHGSRQR
jgi:hypothetical protein